MSDSVPNVRPTKIIDLTEFGKEGEIVLSEPDFRRLQAVQNTMVKYSLTDAEKVALSKIEGVDERKAYINQCLSEKAVSVQTITALAYIEKAPFHLNDYRREFTMDVDAYFDFLTPQLANAILQAVQEIDNPLPN